MFMFALVRVLVSVLIGAIEFFLGVRFLLRLFGANGSAPFVRWIYDMSEPLIAPFSNIFPNARIDGFVFDFTTLFALFIYVFMGYLVMELIAYINYTTRNRTPL